VVKITLLEKPAIKNSNIEDFFIEGFLRKNEK